MSTLFRQLQKKILPKNQILGCGYSRGINKNWSLNIPVYLQSIFMHYYQEQDLFIHHPNYILTADQQCVVARRGGHPVYGTFRLDPSIQENVTFEWQFKIVKLTGRGIKVGLVSDEFFQSGAAYDNVSNYNFKKMFYSYWGQIPNCVFSHKMEENVDALLTMNTLENLLPIKEGDILSMRVIFPDRTIIKEDKKKELDENGDGIGINNVTQAVCKNNKIEFLLNGKLMVWRWRIAEGCVYRMYISLNAPGDSVSIVKFQSK